MVFQLCQIMYQCCLFEHTESLFNLRCKARRGHNIHWCPFFCRCCSAWETVNRGGAASTGSGCASPPGVRASEPAADSRLELQPGRHQPANLPNPHLSSDDQPLFPLKAQISIMRVHAISGSSGSPCSAAAYNPSKKCHD